MSTGTHSMTNRPWVKFRASSKTRGSFLADELLDINELTLRREVVISLADRTESMLT